MAKQDELKQFIAQKAFDKWADDNQRFIEDLHKILEDMVMFEAMHGHRIRPMFEPYEPPQGRNLGAV